MRAFIQNLAAMFSDQAPIREATLAIPGSQSKASRGDHQHPRLTSASWNVTDANGEATFTFTRTFAAKPTIDLSYEEATNNQPCIFKVKSWVTNANGEYTGMVAKGYRLQTLPASITLLGSLASFSVTINAPAGINVSCIAVQVS